MKLKRQPHRSRPVAREPGAAKRRPAPQAKATGRGRGRMARRPGPPLRRRLALRLPRLGRVLAVLALLVVVGGLAALLNSPWLRVSGVAWAGERYTRDDDLETVLEAERGASVLMVDTASVARTLERLPAVAQARVEATLSGELQVSLVERTPTIVWQTPRGAFLAADDGTLFAVLPGPNALDDELAALPLVEDGRASARLTRVGDVVPSGLVETARRLAALDPAALGSTSARLTLRIDDQYGFMLVSGEPTWRIAFGVYGYDPDLTVEDIASRIDRQVAAVRTLFATEAEAAIAWVDARNPGKVYFRARG